MAPATVSAGTQESIVTEKTKDEDQKFNVVIYGIEECKKGTPRYEKFICDLNKVNSIITNVESGISPPSVRAGPFQTGQVAIENIQGSLAL